MSAEKLGKPIRFLYGEQGKYSLGREMTEPPTAAPPTDSHPLRRRRLPFRVFAAQFTSPGRPRRKPNPEPCCTFLGSGACVFDYNGDSHPDIFLVNADGKGNAALYRNTGKGTFVECDQSRRSSNSRTREWAAPSATTTMTATRTWPSGRVTESRCFTMKATEPSKTSPIRLRPGAPAGPDAASPIDPYAASSPEVSNRPTPCPAARSPLPWASPSSTTTRTVTLIST